MPPTGLYRSLSSYFKNAGKCASAFLIVLRAIIDPYGSSVNGEGTVTKRLRQPPVQSPVQSSVATALACAILRTGHEPL